MPTATTPDRMLNTREAAEVLGLRSQTLAMYRSLGRHPDLRFVRVGGAVRYRMSDVLRWLDSRTVGTPIDADQD